MAKRKFVTLVNKLDNIELISYPAPHLLPLPPPLLPTGHILQSPSANVLPTLPFHVLRALFSTTPLTTDDGVLLRRMALEIGAIHLILACLSALSHHAPRIPNACPNASEVRGGQQILQLSLRFAPWPAN